MPSMITSGTSAGTDMALVAWFGIEDLGALVRRHRADDSINKAIRRITRVDLIIVDDIGMLAVGEDAAESFYRLVDACYEKRSLAVSSNLHPAGFDEIMPQDAGHRDRRSAAAPRPHLLHRRPVLPPRPSHRRQGSDALAELNRWGDLTSVHGEDHGHQWGDLMTASGEIVMTVDKVSRAQAPPAFDQNDIWQLVTQIPGCLIGGPARRGAVITCHCAAT